MSISVKFVNLKLLIMVAKTVVTEFTSADENMKLKLSLRYFESAMRRLTDISYSIETSILPTARAPLAANSFENTSLELVSTAYVIKLTCFCPLQRNRFIRHADFLSGMVLCLNCIGVLLTGFYVLGDLKKTGRATTEDVQKLTAKVRACLDANFPNRAAIAGSELIKCHIPSPLSFFHPHQHTQRIARNKIHFYFRAAQLYRNGGEHKWADSIFNHIEADLVSLGCTSNPFQRGSFVRSYASLGQWTAAVTALIHMESEAPQYRLVVRLLQNLSWRVHFSPEHDADTLRSLKMMANSRRLSLCFPLLVSTNWLSKQDYFNWYSLFEGGMERAILIRDAVKDFIPHLPPEGVAVGIQTVSPNYRRRDLSEGFSGEPATEDHAFPFDSRTPSFESLLSKEGFSKLTAKSHQIDLEAGCNQSSGCPTKVRDATGGEPVRVTVILWNPLGIGVDISRLRVIATKVDDVHDSVSSEELITQRIEARNVALIRVNLKNCREGTWYLSHVAVRLNDCDLDAMEEIFNPREVSPRSLPIEKYLGSWGSTRLWADRTKGNIFTVRSRERSLRFDVKVLESGESLPLELVLGEVVECCIDWSPRNPMSLITIVASGLDLYEGPNKKRNGRLSWKGVLGPTQFSLFA